MTFSHKARNERWNTVKLQASGDQDNNPDGQGNKQNEHGRTE